jgi:flagellar hook-length control protein FliK
MQNLPIITAQPAPSTPSSQSTTSTDSNSTSQAAEPFGNVLARQRSNTDSPQVSRKSDSTQQGSSAANNSSATGTDNQTAQATPVIPDASSMLPGNMLVALLPTTAVTSVTTTKDKIIPQAPTPDGVSTLPSDMLAMMLPASAGTNNPVSKVQAPASDALPGNVLSQLLPANAANGKGLQESVLTGSKTAQSQLKTTAVSGTSLKSLENKVLSEFSSTGATSTGVTPTGASAGTTSTGVTVTEVSTKTDSTFAAVLGTLNKSGTKTAELDTGAIKIQMQQVAPPTVDNLLQSGIAPIASSQSGATQAVQTAQTVINTPVTDQAWGNEFSQKITWMATQHEQTAELHLNPPNLGPLDVVLKVSGDQATALFTSPHAAVRDAVEQALPQLRTMMADNGITLGNASVSDQSPKDQQAWQANQQQKGNGGNAGTTVATVASVSIPSVATTLLGSLHQGMVDTFA